MTKGIKAAAVVRAFDFLAVSATHIGETCRAGVALDDVGTLGVLDDRYKLTSTGTVDTTIADELSLRASAGVSIHGKSPMGPIRFDISKVLSKEDYDKTESFRFSTSTQF